MGKLQGKIALMTGGSTGIGLVALCAKAYSSDGVRQPEFGYRNAIHRVEVKVV